MGKDKYFSVFIKYGHVLYCFFLFCLLPFERIREKRENKTHVKISHSRVYLSSKFELVHLKLLQAKFGSQFFYYFFSKKGLGEKAIIIIFSPVDINGIHQSVTEETYIFWLLTQREL